MLYTHLRDTFEPGTDTMKLISYRYNGNDTYGVALDDCVADIGRKFDDRSLDIVAALADGGFDDLVRAGAGKTAEVPLQEVEHLPTIVNPPKVICVGLNYKSHIEEMGRDTPEYPMLFARYADSQVGHEQPMVRPKVSDKYDFEGELAFVVGRAGRHIAAKNALDHIAGYACFNDGSIRDYQRHTTQFMPGKTFFHSGAMGPWMVTADDIPDPTALTLTTRLNDEVMQQATTDDLLFDIPTLIEYLSQIAPLVPGTVVATGTTGGVGAGRTPPVWMKAGDIIEIDISNIGILRNTIIDEA